MTLRTLGSPRIAPFVPEEPGLRAHCQRVAYFARFLGDTFQMSPGAQQDIVDAALSHHSPLLCLGRAGANHLQNDLKVSFAPEASRQVEQLSTVEAIVSGSFGSYTPNEPAIASEILEACNRLDETVEFCPYDGISVDKALDFFGLTGDPIFYRLLGLVLYESPRRLNGREELRRIDGLPVLPKSARRLLELSEETATVADLESIAKTDQVLAATLISRANAAIHSRISETRSIREAVVYLGISSSRNLLLAASFYTLFASGSLSHIWKHAVKAAETAQELAIVVGQIVPAEAYLAGLVHDMGRLVIERFPQAPRLLELELVENGFSLVYAEAIAYRIDHAELGAELLRAWHFPNDLVAAVQYHHRPEASDLRLSSLLYLSEVLCESNADHTFEDLPSVMRICEAEKRLGMTLGQMRARLLTAYAKKIAG